MPAKRFEYAVIRLVPRVERQEFINVGILISCQAQRSLVARWELKPERLAAFAPALDLDFVEAHLTNLARVCKGEGPIGALPYRERFYWLAAPRSTILQLSPLHCGFSADIEATLEHLLTQLVR